MVIKWLTSFGFVLVACNIVVSQQNTVPIRSVQQGNATNTTIPIQKDSTNKSNPGNNKGDKVYTGVSVSPATIHLAMKPGSTQVKELLINNDTKETHRFQLSFSDFAMGRNGAPIIIKPGTSSEEDMKYALSKWTTLTPSYIELKSGESGKVRITVRIPNDETGNFAAWTLISVDNIKAKTPLSAGNDPKSMSIGVNPNFGFGIYVFQNPPNVAVNNVEIQKVRFLDSAGVKNVIMNVRNVGDGIGFCTSYLELTSLNTGKKMKLGTKQFTILPQYFRDFSYELPKDLPKGKYSAIGVIDYGNEDDIKIAEINLTIE